MEGVAAVLGEAGMSLGDIDLIIHGTTLATNALIERKGQAIAIEALGELPGAQLVLVGTGADEARLRALAAKLGLIERVHFAGSLDHDVLPLILSAADAMVLPTANEGIANAWIEALACGTRLVTCDVGGAREVVTGPLAGQLVARDPQSVAAGVRAVLAEPANRLEVAALAEKFSWEANAAALAAHFERLTAEEN